MAVPFTQFKRPNGREETVTIDRPDEIETLARALIARGCRFEIEVLMTGEVSMECVRDGEDDPETLSMEIVSNGPEVPEAVDRLVRAALVELPVPS